MANPLHRNDPERGRHAPSWYAASSDHPARREPLRGAQRADVAIVGAGFTGLWAAKVLAEAGLKPVVLEAHVAGWGASGRNGGQVGSGFNTGQRALERLVGEGTARAAWDLAEEAKRQLRDFVAAEAPEARYLPGVAHGHYTASEHAEAGREADHLGTRYGYDAIEVMDRDRFRALVKSPRYVSGLLDRGAGHIHPLRYALALARSAEKAGAVIHEHSEVTAVERGATVTLRTAEGSLGAPHAILAGNGYLPDLDAEYAARVMPINSFIGATEPLGDRWTDILGEDVAVADSKFVVNYYRMSEDRRFLFGGRESYGLGFPRDLAGPLRGRLANLFPQLAGVAIEQVWGGTLAITMSRLPFVRAVAPNVLAAGGFSGHGVALSGVAGRVMAEAVLGQAARLGTFAALPTPRFPGGARARAPLLALAMTWYALRDRLGV